jgi:drug/metabolite transporter (DMT)-like permease
VTAVMAAALFGERLDSVQIVGMVLVTTAVFAISRMPGGAGSPAGGKISRD